MISKRQIVFFSALALLFAAWACGGSSSSDSSSSVTPTSSGSSSSESVASQECRIILNYSDQSTHDSALEALTQSVFSPPEVTPTTMCLYAPISPLANFSAEMRIEFEDNEGFHYVTFHPSTMVYSQQGSGAMRIIYLDEYGYVELNVSGGNSGTYTGDVRIANMTQTQDYLQSIDSFLAEIVGQCNAANSSPAFCLNPAYATNGIQAPPTPGQIVNQAEEAFSSQLGATGYELGTVEFTPSDMESSLF